MSDSVQPQRRQPTRLPCPWDSPGKNTGVGCHFLLQCMKVKSEREVTQSCPTLSDPMDCSPPGSSVLGIFQARVSIGVWIYLWAFCFVPLIYISVFVPVPYCLDDCGFVVEPEVRQADSSSSFFFLKIALAIRGFLYFHTT